MDGFIGLSVSNLHHRLAKFAEFTERPGTFDVCSRRLTSRRDFDLLRPGIDFLTVQWATEPQSRLADPANFGTVETPATQHHLHPCIDCR
jgi:hypothetical protein